MKYWVIRFTQLFGSPTYKTKLLDMPKGSIVEKTGQTIGEMSEVIFITRSKIWTGWTWTAYLEELHYEYPLEGVFPSEVQTPYPYDAAQYIVAYGGNLYNLCGEACVAWIIGVNIMDFLGDWKAKPLSWFNKIILNGKSLLTGIPELIDMAKTYDSDYIELKNKLYDPLSKSVLLSPNRIKEVLREGYKLVWGCSIAGTGELQKGGIRHWIVINNITPDGIDEGWVEIYNPYTDRKKMYSWRIVIESAGIPVGLFVR